MQARTLALLAPKGRPQITDADVHAVRGTLPTDLVSGPIQWADGRRVAFMPVAVGEDHDELAEALGQLTERLTLDVTLAPDHFADNPNFAGPKLLVADMESTIIEQEMLDELAGEIGLRDRVAKITERAMRGELDFEAAITERVALLAGLDAAVLDTLAAERISTMAGARELVATMKARGAYCALVSGGFTHFTRKVAAELGFDEHRANSLEIVNGKLTGRVVPPILGKNAKLAALRELSNSNGLTVSETVAVGDGANDLAMLREAGLGVAFRAKPQVQAEMRRHPRGAVVTHCDLTAILYLQGAASIAP
ncbi:MAG: phosphoserine phosphatase SerB [Hyphomicrobiaceae bacterium]